MGASKTSSMPLQSTIRSQLEASSRVFGGFFRLNVSGQVAYAAISHDKEYTYLLQRTAGAAVKTTGGSYEKIDTRARGWKEAMEN